MTVYVVTWNLNKEKPKYQEARKAFLENLEYHYDWAYDPLLETVRFISTNQNTEQVYQTLISPLDNNDRLLIVRLQPGGFTGWMNPEIDTWITKQLRA